MTDKKQKTTKAKKFFLLKKTFRFLILITATSTISILLIIYLIKNSRESSKKIDSLRKERSVTISKTKELDRKLTLTKTYMSVWENEVPKNMKDGDGVNIEKIKNLLEKLAKRHYFINNNINFSIPTDILVSKTSVFKFSNVEITMNFGCLTEYNIYNFLNDLKTNNDFGIYIIENMEIRKTANLDKQFVKNIINNNKINPLLNASLKLQWYEFKKR